MAGRIDDARRTPVVDRQGVRGRSREVAVEVDEIFGRRTGVAVNNLVVVAHPKTVVGRCGQEPDQQEVGRIEILEFIDEEITAFGLGHAPRLRIPKEDLERTVDLLVEIHRTEVGQRRPIASESLGDARSIGHGLFHQFGCRQSQPNGGESLEVRGHRVGVGLAADLDLTLQQVPDGRLLEHAQSIGGSAPAPTLALAALAVLAAAAPLAACPTARAPELVADPQSEAVQGADVEGWRTLDIGAPQAQLARRLVVVRQRGDGARVHVAVTHQVPQPFREDPGLARTGGSDDPGRADEVAHCGQLVRREIGDRWRPAERTEAAALGIPAMDHADSGDQNGRLRRTPIDEEWGSVGQDDVGRAALCHSLVGEAASCFTPMPPDGISGATALSTPGVVVIGPQQELQPLAAELEIGCMVIDREVAALGFPDRSRVGVQLDHDGPAVEPVTVEFLHHRGRGLQGRSPR